VPRYTVKVGSLEVVIDPDLLYTESDEWVRIEGDTATVGITDYAQKKLQDIVGVEPPEPGARVKKGDVVAFVESVKASAEIYAPLTGEIIEANEDLVMSPEKVNQDPYGEGWIFRMRIENPDEVKELLTHEEYVEHLRRKEGAQQLQ